MSSLVHDTKMYFSVSSWHNEFKQDIKLNSKGLWENQEKSSEIHRQRLHTGEGGLVLEGGWVSPLGGGRRCVRFWEVLVLDNHAFSHKAVKYVLPLKNHQEGVRDNGSQTKDSPVLNCLFVEAQASSGGEFSPTSPYSMMKTNTS